MVPPTKPPQTSSDESRMRRLAILGGPTTRPISGRRFFPLYGLIHHVRRRSGTEYSTPVVVRQTADAMYVPLPFGARTDWYRNARAAGGVRGTWKGSDRWLANPTIVDRASARDAFDPVMQSLMGFDGIELVVRFDP